MTGPELKALRLAHNLTARELAQRLNLKGGARVVYRWESGGSEISGPTEIAIKTVLKGRK